MFHGRNQHRPRNWSKIAFALVVCAGVLGCHKLRHGHPRPTVQELFQEALVDTANHPEQTFAHDVPDLVEAAQAESMLTVDGIPIAGEEIDVPVPEEIEGEAGVVGDDSEPLVNQDFIETDVREALILMAEDAEVDYVVDEKVTGIVNTTIEDLPYEEALDKVLLPLGFVYAKHDGKYFIAPASPESPLFPYVSEQSEYRPLHLTTTDLMAVVSQQMLPFVREIDTANVIVIDAPKQYAEQILERFRKIDQPIPQVVLEAIVCVISPDSGFQFGIDWEHVHKKQGSEALKLGVSGLAISGTVTPSGLENVFDDFSTTSSFVRLLSENGYLSIRAAPRVVAKDGEKAEISINRESWFSVQPSNANAGDNNAFFFQQEIQQVESGISLVITPKIRGDLVTVDIEKAEVSEDIRNANPDLAVNPFPTINRRSVSTTVHVKNGKTIVIGGLVQKQTVDRVNKVPFLGDMWLLGPLFKTVQRQTQDAEVVIFISPRIVTPPTHTEIEVLSEESAAQLK